MRTSSRISPMPARVAEPCQTPAGLCACTGCVRQPLAITASKATAAGIIDFTVSILVLEDVLHLQTEELCDPEGERQGWVVTVVLDSVHRVARDVEPFGEFGLGPVSFGAQNADAVPHVGCSDHCGPSLRRS